MHRKARILWLVLLLVLAVCAAGCQKNEEAEEPVFPEEGTLSYLFCGTPDGAGSDYWGDLTVATLPSGSHVMIDTSCSQYSAYFTARLKNEYGVESVDTAIITHFHSDHYGGLKNFIQDFGIRTVYINGIELNADLAWNTNAAELDAYIKDIRAMGVDVKVVMAGDTFDIEDVKAEVYYPSEGTTAATTNDTSMLFSLSYGGHKTLFCSDLYYAGESCALQEIGETSVLDADLMKIMHHGADTSGGREFIEAVSPRVAVCMGGHVVSGARLARYTTIGCDVYQTWRDGDTRVTFDGDGPVVWTEKLGLITPSEKEES